MTTPKPYAERSDIALYAEEAVLGFLMAATPDGQTQREDRMQALRDEMRRRGLIKGGAVV